jgi:tetratricopeptide (TPR) repeat protein
MRSTLAPCTPLALLFAVLVADAAAQAPPLVLPRVSQRASVSQTVGLTEITITYDRPGINGREVWGKLVPYDSVWRAGANVNTVLAVTSPVKVQGQPLAAGRYGVHMIPTAGTWTVILSREANAWGSFSYDPKEDVLRVKATPKPSEPVERLIYTFDDPDDSSVLATLRWEKLAVPVKIEVDTRQVVADSLREQLRGLARFSWQPWAQAAAWCAAHDVNLDEATKWADNSIGLNRNFTNLRVKATLIEKRGDAAGAAGLRQESLGLATEAEMNLYGYELTGQGHLDSAIVIFRKNVKDYPKSWNTYDSLGEAYAKKGDKKQAVANYSKALGMVGDETQKQRIKGALAQLQ